MSKSQPILSFIEGIDENARYLTQSEIDKLTSTNPKSKKDKGDWFAQWLAKTPVSERQLSFRGLLTKTLPPNSYQSFAVADGIPIIYDKDNKGNPLNCVSRSLRFVTVSLPDSDGEGAIGERTLCIVGGADPDGTAGDYAFLQCASWNPHALGTRKGLTRFYQRNPDQGWIFFGDGFNAFNTASSNHGPFDGHVGGALIMKELTVPWTHWYNTKNANEFRDSLGSTPSTPSLCDPHNALYDELFTSKNGTAFDLLSRAEDLEPIVETSVSRWYSTRFSHDFFDSTGVPFTSITTVIENWIGHILLSRAMNIVTSATSTAQIQQRTSELKDFPATLFYNKNALQVVLSQVGMGPGLVWDFSIDDAVYEKVIGTLKIGLYYDDLDTGERKLAVPGSEGPFAMPIIEPGLEDYQGVIQLAPDGYDDTVQLLPQKAIAAMLMVDFWNPMYSLKRSQLMQYLPDKATLQVDTQAYDVLPQFVANVKASGRANVKESAEYEILQLLDTPDDWVTTFTTRVNAYIQRIHDRLTGGEAQSAVEEYMILAEGRRRLYKGWESSKPDGSGLDEFRMTLPIAAYPNPFPLSEMTEMGEVKPVPSHQLGMILTMPGVGTATFRHGTGGCPAYSRAAAARKIHL